MKQIRWLLEVASKINGDFIDSCNMTCLSADGKKVITVPDPRKSEIEGVSRITTWRRGNIVQSFAHRIGAGAESIAS